MSPNNKFTAFTHMAKKQPKTKRSLWKRFKSFMGVQVWLQKIRFQALGSWYVIEVISKILDRVYGIFSSFINGLIINEVIFVATQHTKDLTKLGYFVGASLVLSLVQRIFFTIYYQYYWLKADRKFGLYLDKLIIEKLAELDWEHIENPKTEKHINMTFQNAKWRIPQVIDVHFDFIAVIISIVTAFKLPSIPLLLIPILIIKELPLAYLRFVDRKVSFKVQDDTQQDNIRMQSIIGFFRDFRSLLEVKVSSVTKSLISFRNQKDKFIEGEYLKIQKKYSPWYTGLGSIDTVFSTGVYIYYLEKVIFEGMLLGTFNFTTSAIFNLSNSISRIFSQVTRLFDNYRYIRYAYDLLNMHNKRKDGDIEFTGDKVRIEYKNVWFKYPLTKKWVLKNISLTVEDNDRIALVGENGAGKSTFLKLLMLAYYPTKGEILINGIELSKYRKSSISKMLSLVSQDFARYDVLSVEQNIAIYTDINTIDKKKLEQAADYSASSDFIKKLDHKYETLLTKRLEGGTELSTGQWQRIAVARQFYSSRPLIILDEPTASIDPVAEAKIFDNIYHHVKDKTVIVVSHRYNTVRAAKKILVFKDGEIIEQGTHDELIEKKGYYENAYNVQNQEKKL